MCHFTMLHGVPRGSVWRTLLYALQTQELLNIFARYGIKAHQYADDIVQYLSVHTDDGTVTASRLKRSLIEVEKWVRQDQLPATQSKQDSGHIPRTRAAYGKGQHAVRRPCFISRCIYPNCTERRHFYRQSAVHINRDCISLSWLLKQLRRWD